MRCKEDRLGQQARACRPAGCEQAASNRSTALVPPADPRQGVEKISVVGEVLKIFSRKSKTVESEPPAEVLCALNDEL